MKMKKHCCSCNDYDLVCCISMLSLKSDVGLQTDFSKKNKLVLEIKIIFIKTSILIF